jgi:hypothetical protein
LAQEVFEQVPGDLATIHGGRPDVVDWRDFAFALRARFLDGFLGECFAFYENLCF